MNIKNRGSRGKAYTLETRMEVQTVNTDAAKNMQLGSLVGEVKFPPTPSQTNHSWKGRGPVSKDGDRAGCGVVRSCPLKTP